MKYSKILHFTAKRYTLRKFFFSLSKWMNFSIIFHNLESVLAIPPYTFREIGKKKRIAKKKKTNRVLGEKVINEGPPIHDS